MLIKVFKHYAIDDPTFLQECDIEVKINSKVVLAGDDYHDSIYAQLQGFLKAFDHFRVKYEIVETKIADLPARNTIV